MASVRNILEAEERKERAAPALAPPPAPRQPQPRIEPQLKANGAVKPVERAEPVFASAPAPQAGFAEASAPAFDLEKSPAKTESRAGAARAPARRKTGNNALVSKVLATIPRKTRVGVAETVEILISKEEAGLIFGWLSRQGPQQRNESEAPCRAVTLRLTAPEGGFFIEGAAPETQWLLDRPAFLGDEAFGTWAWSVIPNEAGAYGLTLSMAAREVDANGVANSVALPDQVVKVQVRGSFWRGFGRFLRGTLLLLAGSGLTVAAYYALKAAGKLPNLP